MRNLKKVLSLALALVMLLGMMVVGAGAATKFQDDDKIQNKEAVSVLVGLGVMKGREDGSNFAPTATLTRAEAAKMIAQLDLGVEAADALKANGNNTFSDVWTDHWAAGAIDYCVEQGYINGDGAGHFFPGRNVTGVQFASMLLRLLGYDAKIEELVGDQWAVKAAALARKAGLTTNVMANGEDMTRDGMAQMAFNALTAPMVEYEGMDITIGDVAINARVKIRTHTGNALNNNNSTYDYGEIKSNITPIRLCEERFPTLKLNRNDELDKFGRRCSVWKYKNLKIAGSENTIEPDLHYNTKVTDKTDPAEWAKMENLYAATNANGAITMQLWINGQNVTPTNQTVDSTSYAPGTRGWISYYTAPGREVEVYMNKDNLREVERVVVVDTVLGEVTKENADDTISVKLMKTPDNKVTTGSVTLNTKEGVGNVKKGDIVLVQGYFKDSSQEWRLNKDTTITSVEAAPIITGFATLKGYDKNQEATYITVDGEKYIDAFSVVEEFTINDFSLNDEGFDCTLYMDNHGNIMKAIPGKDPNLVNDGLIAVKESYQTLKDGKLVTMVKGVISNGQTVTWQVDNEMSKIPANNIYTWKDVNNKRILSAIPEAGLPYSVGLEKEDEDAHVATKKAGAISFKSSDVFGKDKANKVMYASDVKFIFVGESGISVLTGRQTYNLEAGKTVAQAFKDGEITAVFIGTDPDVVDVNDLIYVYSRWLETDEVVDVDGKQVLYHGYKAYNADGSEIEHFLGTKNTGMANHFFKTAKTDDGKAWKPETSKTVDEHTMTSAVVAKKNGGDAWANNEDAFVLVKDGNGDEDFVDDVDTHYDFLGSKSTKVVDLTDAKLYIESVADINEAVKDGYYVEVAVIYNATDAPAAARSEGNVRAAVTVFVTKISSKDADTSKIPEHEVTGGDDASADGAYTVESKTQGATKALSFYLITKKSVDDGDVTIPTTAAEVEALVGDKWTSSVKGASKGDTVLVKAAGGLDAANATPAGIQAADILDAKTLNQAGTVSPADIPTNGGIYWKLTMGEQSLIIKDVAVTAATIDKMSISPNGKQVNIKMGNGTFANDTEKCKAAVEYINSSVDGWTATLGAADAAGEISEIKITNDKGTSTRTAGELVVSTTEITVDDKSYVMKAAATGTTGGLTLADVLEVTGKTITSAEANVFVLTNTGTVGTYTDASKIAGIGTDDLTAFVTNGAEEILTNDGAGYAKLAAFAVKANNAIDDTAGTGAATAAVKTGSANVITGDGGSANKYAAIGKTFTVEVTTGKVIAEADAKKGYNFKIDGTVTNGTAEVSGEITGDAAIAKGAKFDVTVTVKSVSGGALGAITLDVEAKA